MTHLDTLKSVESSAIRRFVTFNEYKGGGWMKSESESKLKIYVLKYIREWDIKINMFFAIEVIDLFEERIKIISRACARDSCIYNPI